MNFRQLAVSAAVGVTALALGAGPAAAADSGSAGSAGSAGIGDLRVSVGYGCRTTGTGPADWRTSAHVFTTVTNVGSAPVRGVGTSVWIPLTYSVTNHAAEIAPGQTVVYDNDTFSTALILNPVGATAFGVGLDANPFDNLYAGAAPFVCSAL
ncbi:hypothetical protein [Rhodococcus sp. MTM3W5.2]|uniref:hypothetical protein n=1 Tax=Rhodococcus sp. MTM3W5.2 TaxID=1805827 RepID=UPI0011AE6C4C|nr:hypothetical protein [Rhodococcus sp. MTM3W5.2]